ncbi:myosin light chain kinase 3 isoform X2 [Ictalurus furcatus]|uniref:myosin light chain kinase 3 isoform X2 n=1 Tax=Ictalurus furcatus TaxID=66913 RepID=UPI0023502413|nr:myosin light chain kinase 3 isoform X2 [Ictalurus furcatus]
MSKPVTLATCIAKMYEGAKLDNSGAASGSPKKASSTLLGSLGHIEEKIKLLEGRVEQVTNTQSLVLQKLESVCKGMVVLEKNFAQINQDKAVVQSFIKPPRRDAEQGVCDSAAIAEVKSLCGETVALLMSLKQEGQLQRKKIEGIESSVSTLDKVLGYVGEAFRSSKIVEFILSGVVPWRKQGLLDATDDQKNTSDGDATKAKSSFCHTGTQAPEELNEQPAVPHKHQEHKVNSPALGSFPALTGEVPALKSQRRPKEVTLKSREPGRVQAFAPESPSEPEALEVSKDDKVLPAESISVTAASQLESKTPETETPGTPECTDVSAAAVLPSVDSLIKRQEPKQKTECEQKTKDVPEAEPCHDAKPNLPITENLEQKESVALETPQPTEAEREPKPVRLTQETGTETADVVLEKPKTPQNKSEPSKRDEVASSAPQSEDPSKSAGLDLQFPIIDDCPPRPAPFEHRIVSAKQVPIGSYYTVEPNELLGGGRFGQVHKCAERSSGLTLAAKMIKVKGLKEREEVKNEIGMMNQLNHVNLIQLYDAFESRTNLTLIMEYVEGGELFDRIVNEDYQLTELDAIVFMRQICEGVQYLHQQYILHLDLKPENILCVSSTSNQIKIIDFGLARKYRPREKLKVNFGTPEFLAPEVVNYDFVSFPTDMWSVGVITYMLLSGLSPFLGENDAETMNNILHANWDFDAEAFENVSEEAKDFISKLLIPAKCSRLSASGCMKHSWLNNLEEKAKQHRVRLKSQMRLQRYLAAHRQWKKHFHAVTAANRLKRFQKSRSSNTL